MPRNVEIKARIADRAAVEQRVRALADSGPTVIRQEDTFFRATSGRLKLRVLDSTQGQLIHYRRADAGGPRESDYAIVPVERPDALRAVLADALGVTGTVRKTRTLYMAGRTRIHLDEVDGLGSFVEIEVVLGDGEPVADGEAEALRLTEALGIRQEDLVPVAYVDLLRKPG
jgi:predicted adenylyl cyclase CyaB